ncbi:MAG: hypothetical protein HUU46_09680 [Candidatus Hydrogenedentes bacterium]|nr:hypothetical protein [Candidatus Hydrogenedentota bacterium]
MNDRPYHIGHWAAALCAACLCVAAGDGARPGDPVTTLPDPQVSAPAANFKVQSPRARTPGAKGVDINVSNLMGNESEVGIDVNPTDANNQVIAGHSPDFATLNTFYSMDGGQTWTHVPLGDAEDGKTSTFRFDPSVAFDADGNVFVAYGATVDGGMGTTDTVVIVAKSTDGGQNYTHFAYATTAPDDPAGTTLPGSDKWQLATGPDPDDAGQENVYLAMTANIDDPGGLDQRIVLLPSFDGGESFVTSLIVNDNSLGSSNETGNIFAEPAVGPNGETYVVWHNTASGKIFVDVSDSWFGGSNFGTDQLVTTINSAFASGGRIGFKVPIPAQPDRGVFAGPNIDVDRSGGTHNGRLYISYVDVVGTMPDTDVFVRYSDDQGATWSTAVAVTNDTNSQFLPWLDVDQSSGRVGVIWYDARNDVNNQLVEVFLGVSDDGGDTFSVERLASDAPSNQSVTNANRTTNNFLEYIGVACQGSMAYLVWSDNSLDAADLDYFTDQLSLLPDQPILSVIPANRDVGAAAGNTSFDVSNTGTGMMNWSAQVISGSDWLSISSGDAGVDAGTIECAFTTNDGAERVGAVRVEATGATGSPVDVTVTQAAGADEPSITVTAPNGGEVWHIGEKETISWTSAGALGPEVRIELWRNGAFVRKIKNETPNDGQLKWKVKDSVAQGNGYKVKIVSTADDSISDQSDSKFKVRP